MACSRDRGSRLGATRSPPPSATLTRCESDSAVGMSMACPLSVAACAEACTQRMSLPHTIRRIWAARPHNQTPASLMTAAGPSSPGRLSANQARGDRAYGSQKILPIVRSGLTRPSLRLKAPVRYEVPRLLTKPPSLFGLPVARAHRKGEEQWACPGTHHSWTVPDLRRSGERGRRPHRSTGPSAA